MDAAGAPWSAIARGEFCMRLLHLDVVTALAPWPDALSILEAQGIIDAEEGYRLQSFSLAKRRVEWLAGRLTAKAALQHHCSVRQPEKRQVFPARFTIGNDRHGRPFVARGASLCSQQPFLSISHSRALAAAMVACVPCGLDLQVMDSRLERLQERFASPAEVALGHGCAPLVWLAMLWAAKEAVKKCHYHDQPTFMERIRVVARTDCASGPRPVILSCRLSDRPGVAQVRVSVCGDYALAVSLGGEYAGAA